MKQLQLFFEEDEFERLKSKKDELGMTWHDFFMTLVSATAEKQKKEVEGNGSENKDEGQ